MLVLSRRPNESVVVDGGIRITVVSVRGNQVRLGFEAPGNVGIFREELLTLPEDHREDGPGAEERHLVAAE